MVIWTKLHWHPRLNLDSIDISPIGRSVHDPHINPINRPRHQNSLQSATPSKELVYLDTHMLSTDARLGIGTLDENIARGSASDNVLLAAFEELQKTASIEFLGVPFDAEGDLAWFPAFLFDGPDEFEVGVCFGVVIACLNALILARWRGDEWCARVLLMRCARRKWMSMSRSIR